MTIQFRRGDLNNSNDGRHILELLNSFSLESSKKKPIDPEIRKTLIQNLIEFGNSFIYFVEHENNPMGIAICIVGFSTFKNAELLNIHDFYIKSEYQNQSIGDKFLKFIEADSREQNFCRITLEVYDANDRAKRLYTKNGFQGITETGKNAPMYAMSKDLY